MALGSESGNGRELITFIEADISDIAKLYASLGIPSLDSILLYITLPYIVYLVVSLARLLY